MNAARAPQILTLMIAIVACYGVYKWRQVEQSRPTGGIANVSRPLLKDFELTERSGQMFRSADMQGKVWVTTFFFSTCDGTCSRLNANIRRLNQLEALQDVTWVSITVDPVTDTLDVLNKYADNLRADPQRWLFCRGELDYVKRLADDVLAIGGVRYQGHNDYAVVVDKSGNVRGYFNAVSISDSEKMTALLTELVVEPWIEQDGRDERDALEQAAADELTATSGNAEPPPETVSQQNGLQLASDE